MGIRMQFGFRKLLGSFGGRFEKSCLLVAVCTILLLFAKSVWISEVWGEEQNLIGNGSFSVKEGDSLKGSLSSWSSLEGYASLFKGDSADGDDFCLKINGGTGNRFVIQDFEVTPGHKYNFTYWVKIPQGAKVSAIVTLATKWVNEDPELGDFVGKVEDKILTEWEQREVLLVVPNDPRLKKARVTLFNGSWKGPASEDAPVFYDDLLVTDVTEQSK